jgi:hypothetical protein
VTSETLPAELDRSTRWMTLLCLALSFGLTMRSVQEAILLPRMAEVRDEISQESPPLLGTVESTRALWDARISAVSPMREAREWVLMLMAVSSSLCFVGAMRYLRPNGLPRPRIATLLTRASFVTAILRTVDGAQEAVVASRTARLAGPELLALNSTDSEQLRAILPLLPSLLVGASVVMTVLIAGAYVGFFHGYGKRREAGSTPRIVE